MTTTRDLFSYPRFWAERLGPAPYLPMSRAEMDTLDALKAYRYTIALAAPSLYAQFGAPATRPMVLAALLNIGFDDVYEVAIGAEIVTKGTAEYLPVARRLGRLPPPATRVT